MFNGFRRGHPQTAICELNISSEIPASVLYLPPSLPRDPRIDAPPPVPQFVSRLVRHLERRVTVADAGQHMRQVDDGAGNKVDDVAFLLDEAGDQDQA